MEGGERIMEDSIRTYARLEALPVSAAGSSSFDDPQQQQIPRGGSGGSNGARGGRGESIPPDGSYEAPPSPLPSPMPQIPSISADSSDDFGLREIFANAESRSRSQDEAELVDGGDGDVKMNLSQNGGVEAKIETTNRLVGQPQEATFKCGPNMADCIAPKPEKVDSAAPVVASVEKQHDATRKEQLSNGSKIEISSPKPSNPRTPPISVSSPRAKSANKSEASTPNKSSKASTPNGKGSGKGAGSGSKPPSGSKAKAPPQSPPPLPIEAQLAGHRRMACKARSVPEGHTPQTAYLTIPPSTPHGTVLACSHPVCSSSGKRFRFCVVCDIPVAKRNFLRRHSHGLINGGATCAAGLAPGLAAGLKPLISGAMVASGSEGNSPASTPQYDTPTSPGGASSGGDVRSDEEAGHEGAGSQQWRGSRSQKVTVPSRVLASPGHAGTLDRNERPIDPCSPMSTGSVRQRTASDGSNRTAHGSPGKRPREGGSPPRRGLVGTVVNGAPPAQAGPQQTDPGPTAGSTSQLARPLPYRPPPIQHCVSWPIVASASAGHPAHGAPQVPTSPMASGQAMYPGAPQWTPGTPGGTSYATESPRYASWTVGSPHQQQQAVLSPAVQTPLPSATSAISPRRQQQQPPTHSGAPKIPHANTFRPSASTTTPKKKAATMPSVSPRYIRGPAMSFDTAIDRDRHILPRSHHRHASDENRRGGNNVDNRRTLSPGLLPELGQGKDGHGRRDHSLAVKGGDVELGGSSNNEDMITNRSRNYDRPSSWTMGGATTGRIEFRRRSSPPRRPEATIWRGRMKSDSALPASHAADEQHDRSPLGHPSPHSRARQTSEPLPHVPSVQPRGASEDDFEPPTPEVSVMRLSRKERMWLNLLRQRPFDEEADALNSWMDEVMVISDPRKNVDNDDGARGRTADDMPPRQLSEVVRQARVMPPPLSRKLGNDIERERRSVAEVSTSDGSQMEAPAARPTQTRPTGPSSSQRLRVEGKESRAAENHGDNSATNQTGQEVVPRSAPREDPKVVVTPPEQDAITERMTEGLAGFFGCGNILNADDAVGLVPCAPCAPCANTTTVDDDIVRRGSTSRDLTRPLPVSQRQQSKSSVASSVSMGNSSAVVFFENTAIMDIDRSTDPLFQRLPRGGSVSSASVSEIGEADMDHTDRHAVFENGGDDRMGNLDTHMHKVNSNIGNSAAVGMDMEAQWRGGEGIAHFYAKSRA